MGSAQGMLAEARKSLGLTGRPNYITLAYAARHGDGFRSAAWCDMAVTWWARRSQNATAVLPAGDRAYTPWHAADFRKIGRWHPGTVAEVDRAEPGDIVFFDWGGSNDIDSIDHVGVVEERLGGGRVQTIEANTGNAVKRRVRGAADIAGYGRPAYGKDEDDMDLSDKVELNEWVIKRWPNDKGLLDGAISVRTGLGSGYAFSRIAAETGEQLLVEVKTLAAHVLNSEKIVTALAAREPEEADAQAIVTGLLSALTPERIADAVVEAMPADMAEQVVTALGQRIGRT